MSPSGRSQPPRIAELVAESAQFRRRTTSRAPSPSPRCGPRRSSLGRVRAPPTALRLLPDDPGWHRTAARTRRTLPNALADGRDDALIVLEESRDAENVRVEAAALTLLGELYAANGDYDDAEATLSEAVQKWREAGDGSGVANALRELGMSHLFRGEHNEADALISEALAVIERNPIGEAWRAERRGSRSPRRREHP